MVRRRAGPERPGVGRERKGKVRGSKMEVTWDWACPLRMWHDAQLGGLRHLAAPQDGRNHNKTKGENGDKEPRTCSCSVLLGSAWYRARMFIAGAHANKELCVLPSPADRLMLEHTLLFFLKKIKAVIRLEADSFSSSCKARLGACLFLLICGAAE